MFSFGAALPGTLRIRPEVDLNIGRYRGSLCALAISNPRSQVSGKAFQGSGEFCEHADSMRQRPRWFRVLAGRLDQHGKARMALHQSGNVGVRWHRPARSPSQWPGTARSSTTPQVFLRMETDRRFVLRDCPLALAWRERRMRRFERSWSSSSFFQQLRGSLNEQPRLR